MALVSYGVADAVKDGAAKLSQEIVKVQTTPPAIPADSEQGQKLAGYVVKLAGIPDLVTQISDQASVLNPSSQTVALGMLKALQDELTAIRNDVKVVDATWASQTGRQLTAVDAPGWLETLLTLAKWAVVGAGIYYGGKLLLEWGRSEGGQRRLRYLRGR